MNESSTTNRIKLIVLAGPTAVGKTAISLEIAKQHRCEIISGDSMQVYRGMDIGTAKVSATERAQVPHHLIDLCEPDEPFSVSDFQRHAREAIADVHNRGATPLLVGGTGLYVQSVCYNYTFTEGGQDPVFRQEMQAYGEQHGLIALHEKLRELDPVTADRLHPNDQRRVIRAMEILHLTGQRMSDQLAEQTRTSPYELKLIGLTMDRELLYARIEKRIDQMLEQGLIEEVQRLLDQGCDESMTSMQGLGYKEIAAYLRGQCTRGEAVELLKRDTRRFAKRQLSWFRQMKEMHWVDMTDPSKISEQLRIINDIIAGNIMFNPEYT